MKKTLVSLTMGMLFSTTLLANDSIAEINAAKNNALAEIEAAKVTAIKEVKGEELTAVQLPVLPKSEGLSVEDFQNKVNASGIFANYGGIEVLQNLGEYGHPSLYQVTIGGRDNGVLSENGMDFFAGDFIKFGANNKIERISSDYRTSLMKGKAKEQVEKLSDEDMIVFSPENPADSVGTVYVYTDTTCGYCRKLHGEIDQLLEANVTVKYIPYPRSGADAEVPVARNQDGSLKYGENKAMFELAAIACQEDQQAAMTAVKSGTSAEIYREGYEANKEVCQAKVKKGYESGQQIGFGGTPFLYLSTGEVVPGYQPADALIQMLKK